MTSKAKTIFPRPLVVGPLGLGILAATVVLLLAALPAHADLAFGPQGSAAGQTNNPSGLAVDDATGELFVADRSNNRVDVFAPDGSFLRAFGFGVDTGANALQVCTTASTCQAGLAGSAAGQLSSPSSVAIDNDPASPSYHDVYVYTGNARVQRFTPAGAFVLAFGDGVNQTTGGDVCTAASGNTCRAGTAGFGPGQFGNDVFLALGLSGTVYVVDAEGGENPPRRVQTFDSAGALTGQPLTIPSGPGVGRPLALAADAAGNFYLANSFGSGAVRKYDPSGNLLATFNDSFNIKGVAVDYSSGDIFVSDVGGTEAVNVYDSSGASLSVIYGDQVRRMAALAARHTANGDVYAVHDDGANTEIVHVPIPPPGPVVIPGANNNFASPVGNTKATLNTRINPEGTAATYHFQYIAEADYATNGNSFSGPNPATSTAEQPVGSDFAPYALSTQITGLAPETAYRFRVIATDGAHTTTGPEATFTTRQPFDFGATYSTSVGTETATLHAELNPLSIAATGRLQYVDEATYQADKAGGDGFQHAATAPAALDPPLDFGAAPDQLTARSASLTGLSPDTTYHYRLLATDSFATKPGPERILRTFPLPDAPQTDCPNQTLRSGPSAELPDCRAYELVSPLDKRGADIVSLGSGVGAFDYDETGVLDLGSSDRRSELRQATPAGDGLTYSVYRAFADPQSAPYMSQYLASRDPAQGWQNRAITPPVSSFSYLGASQLDLHFSAFTPDLCSGFYVQDSDVALAPGDQPGYADLYRVRTCDPTGYDLLTTAAPQNQQAGVIFPGTPPGPLSYKPDVAAYAADGSRAVLRANAKLATSGTQASAATLADCSLGNHNCPIDQLYLAAAGTLRLVSILPNGVANAFPSVLPSGTEPVSQDATRIYWQTQGSLYLRINADRAQSPIDGTGGCTDTTRGCTLPVSGLVASDQARFWAATPDASRALFSLDSGPHAGEFYSYDLATRTASQLASGLVRVLGSSDDLSSIYLISTQALAPGASAGQPNLYRYHGGAFTFIAGYPDYNGQRVVYRVIDDGSKLAFMSRASLTGYDNLDAADVQPASEVYLFDANANGGAGDLACIACNPTGSRPFAFEVPAKFVNAVRWDAARIPLRDYPLYTRRAFSDDGERFFFESYDALLPADTNGKLDVYEWQAERTGGCDAFDHNFFAANRGCLSLISSGQGSSDSAFVDASADGSDVFFTTRQALHGDDRDELIDIYDARVNGGFPARQALGPPCDLDAGACEGPGTSAPENQGVGSSVFQGDPNRPFKWPAAGRCPKGKVKRKGRCVAKHQKHHSRAHHHRRVGK